MRGSYGITINNAPYTGETGARLNRWPLTH